MDRTVRSALRLSLIGTALILAALASYVPSLDNFFWNDDFWWLNHTRRTAADPLLMFEDNMGCFRPLVNTYFALLYPAFGLSPGRYRVVALAIHLLNAFLLGILARRLLRSRWSGYVAAFALTVGWVHYEVVYWISAVTDLVALTFMLGAALLYLRHLDGRGWWSYALSVLMAGGSLLIKESAAVLPLILLLVHLRCSRRRLVRLLPFWALAGVLFGLERSLGIFALHSAKYGPGPHMVTNLLAYARHILTEPFAPWPWLKPVVASALLLPLLAAKRTRPVAVLGAAWLLVGLLPVSQWRYMEQAESRWCYLPMAGLSIWLAGWGLLLSQAARWKQALAVVVVAGFCVHNVLAIRRVEELEHFRFAELQSRLIDSMLSVVEPQTREIVVSHFPPIPEWQVDDISDLYFNGRLVKNDRFPIPAGERVSTPEILVFTYSQERAVLR